MSDDSLIEPAFTNDDTRQAHGHAPPQASTSVDACADTEREPTPSAPPSRGAALSVLWFDEASREPCDDDESAR